MGAVYISIILGCRVVQHLCTKKSSSKVNTMSCFWKYGSFRHLLSGLLGLVLILIGGNQIRFESRTLLISVFSGITLAASTGFNLIALKEGTVALASLFGTAGILVPCIAGIFLFGKPMTGGQWAGILLFFVAAYFLISSSNRIYQGFSVKTFLVLLGVMLSEGFTMLSQQMFAFYVPDGDVSVFSFFSFGTVGGVMLIISLLSGRKKEDNKGPELTLDLLIMGALLSIVVFVINQLATMAASIVSPVVLFTFINGGSTIIGAIVAAIFFKEKITLRSATGIVLGVLALIIIKVF